MKVFRPHLDDVENLSYGKGAKKRRGTGSRFVCHRLNQDERKVYDIAKRAGYLTVKGTGYRKERKGSPLTNIFRQRCDALEEVCIIVEKHTNEDVVVIDFSTLRLRNDATFVAAIVNNVFPAKYPHLHHQVTGQIAPGKSSDSGPGENHRRGNASTAVSTPIDWETVRTKPIWGVNERLITVICDRDVAKALAVDLLEESRNIELPCTTTGYPSGEGEDRLYVKSADGDVSTTNKLSVDEIDWDEI